jgi:hypothetical protein
MDTSGFYKLGEGLLYGSNFVLHKDFELHRETKDQHTYPIAGWYWFDSETQAKEFFNIANEF